MIEVKYNGAVFASFYPPKTMIGSHAMTTGEMMYLAMVSAAATVYAAVLIHCTRLTAGKEQRK